MQRCLIWLNKLIRLSVYEYKGWILLPNRMNFWKSAKGGTGAFSVQKFIMKILGTLVYFTFTLVFEHEIDKKKNNFRVQGMFFQQL